MTQFISFALFAVFFVVAAYSRISADWIFKELEDKYPDYYTKAGRPSLVSYELRRAGLANDILMKALFGSFPQDFPQDVAIMKRFDLIQSLFLYAILPCWVGLIIMMFANMRG